MNPLHHQDEVAEDSDVSSGTIDDDDLVEEFTATGEYRSGEVGACCMYQRVLFR